jgi:hypothetical protein
MYVLSSGYSDSLKSVETLQLRDSILTIITVWVLEMYYITCTTTRTQFYANYTAGSAK